MFWIMGAKLLGTAAGTVLWANSAVSPFWVALMLGVSPIWLEVAATRLTGVEPGHEKRKSYRWLDAAVDETCFVLQPALFFFTRVSADRVNLLGLAVFVLCGTFRLVRFARRGLTGGAFTGLPVTYTGYVWLPLLFAYQFGPSAIGGAILALISAAMVYPGIRIRPSLAS